MSPDPLQARIEHGIADLRARYPRISACRARIDDWREDTALQAAEPRYALWLDIRWPQHQSLISGPPCDSAGRALEAGFAAAARSLDAHLDAHA